MSWTTDVGQHRGHGYENPNSCSLGFDYDQYPAATGTQTAIDKLQPFRHQPDHDKRYRSSQAFPEKTQHRTQDCSPLPTELEQRLSSSPPSCRQLYEKMTDANDGGAYDDWLDGDDVSSLSTRMT